jgi:nitrate reductase delta subunit
LPLLTAAADSLPPQLAGHLDRFCRYLSGTPLDDAQSAYVDTFDLRRRCCLYLTYYSHGDTRKRGMALLRFSAAYRSAGADFVGGELPDHLAVVCEFAATTDLQLGLRLIAENRPGVELLRTSLADLASPWTDVLDAIRAALPPPAPYDVQKALELARTGPPEEEVGLEPFGPPESMGAQSMGAQSMGGRR